MTADGIYETTTNYRPMIQCPQCGGSGKRSDVWLLTDCFRCGGTGSIFDPDPFKVGDIPPLSFPAYTINGLDPALWAYLARLEQKLDRLLAALEDES